MNRRQFLSTVGASAVALTAKPLLFAGPVTKRVSQDPQPGKVRVGVITDLHHMTFKRDQRHRLKAFIDSALIERPDCLIQCGDFCYPEDCPAILEEWNRFEGDKYHVLGNHDMDRCDKPTVTKLWGMPNRYYSFDKGGFHFIVLDRNVFRTPKAGLQDYSHGNWGKAARGDINCIDDEQLAWLGGDLEKTRKPTVVWVHQPLIATDGPNDIGNAQSIIDAFDLANFRAKERGGSPAVVAVFFGHDHNDLYAERNGVHYVLLNSASYAYTSAGASFYSDPLFSYITFDPAGRITITGRSSTYGPDAVPDKVRMRIPPRISSRELSEPA